MNTIHENEPVRLETLDSTFLLENGPIFFHTEEMDEGLLSRGFKFVVNYKQEKIDGVFTEFGVKRKEEVDAIAAELIEFNSKVGRETLWFSSTISFYCENLMALFTTFEGGECYATYRKKFDCQGWSFACDFRNQSFKICFDEKESTKWKEEIDKMNQDIRASFVKKEEEKQKKKS